MREEGWQVGPTAMWRPPHQNHHHIASTSPKPSSKTVSWLNMNGFDSWWSRIPDFKIRWLKLNLCDNWMVKNKLYITIRRQVRRPTSSACPTTSCCWPHAAALHKAEGASRLGAIIQEGRHLADWLWIVMENLKIVFWGWTVCFSFWQ